MKENLLKIINKCLGKGGLEYCCTVSIEHYYDKDINLVEKELNIDKNIFIKDILFMIMETDDEVRLWADGYVEGINSFYEYISEFLEDDELSNNIEKFLEGEGDREDLYTRQALKYCETNDKNSDEVREMERLIRFSSINTQRDVNCYLNGYTKGYESASKRIKNYICLI